jgi:hypothetical protein
MKGRRETEKMNWKSTGAVVVVLVFAIAALALVIHYSPWVIVPTTQTQSSSTASGMEGVVTGYVTASPSQPTCPSNQSCDENMTGYSLIFTPQCAGSTGCSPVLAPLSPSGHYSALLPEGTYTVTGLSPSCPWLGCSTTFPVEIAVTGGMQLVQNFAIDTGIR